MWVVEATWCTRFQPSGWVEAAERGQLAGQHLVPPRAPQPCTALVGPSLYLPYAHTTTITFAAGGQSIVDPVLLEVLRQRQKALALVCTRAELFFASLLRQLLADGGGVLPAQLNGDLRSLVAGALRLSNPFSGDGNVDVSPCAAAAWESTLARQQADFPITTAQRVLLESLHGASAAIGRVVDHMLEVRLRQLTAESLRSLVRAHLILACGVPEAFVDRYLDSDALSQHDQDLLSGIHEGLHCDPLGWSAAQVSTEHH